jgi:hypothetical protein
VIPAELQHLAGRCFRCNAHILWVHVAGKPAAIEPCPEGEGDLAIETPLLGDGNVTAAPAPRTKWRRHDPRCPRREGPVTAASPPRAHISHKRRRKFIGNWGGAR